MRGSREGQKAAPHGKPSSRRPRADPSRGSHMLIECAVCESAVQANVLQAHVSGNVDYHDAPYRTSFLECPSCHTTLLAAKSREELTPRMNWSGTLQRASSRRGNVLLPKAFRLSSGTPWRKQIDASGPAPIARAQSCAGAHLKGCVVIST